MRCLTTLVSGEVVCTVQQFNEYNMDEHCQLEEGEVFKDYDCLLNFVDGNSDKFYRIQLLKNNNGFYVWTRWGRNGTDGQSKLEGPITQEHATKSFKKKFTEKTRNDWDKREQFEAVKGKYNIVPQTESPVSQTSQIPDEFLAQLPADVVYEIMFLLSTRDILRCLQVCKYWNTLLSQIHFWRNFIQKHFDLGIKSDVSNEGPLGQWSGSKDEDWYCYFDNQEDPYVVRPFPSMWNCGVIHPDGLDPMSGDVRSLQGFSRSLEILTHMRKEVSRLEIASGNQCSANEGQDDICVVLFPWEKDDLPKPLDILDDVFHFHPEIIEYYNNHPGDLGEQRQEKLYYHIRREIADDEEDDDEEDEEHDLDTKPCLNRIFGMGYSVEDDGSEFYKWLQPIMVPSVTLYAGSDKLNPVVVFMITKLAPGWVGGALTGVTYT